MRVSSNEGGITVEEYPVGMFSQRSEAQQLPDSARRALENLASRDPTRIIFDVAFPTEQPIHIYTQTVSLLEPVQTDLIPRAAQQGIFFVAHTVPPTKGWEFGLVFKDKDIPQLVYNPNGFPVQIISANQIPGINPIQLVVSLFRSRLEIPVSAEYETIVFQDYHGKTHVILASA